jgi:hypothetical protein
MYLQERTDMITRYTEEESANAYPASTWREVFSSLEPVVGRSVSEVLVEDLKQRGLDVSKGDAHVRLSDVKRALNWLFGDGSEILLDYLQRGLEAKKG